MADGSQTPAENSIGITDNAAKRINELRTSEGNPDLMLRIAVTAGGCSGFQYGFDLDDKIVDEDVTFEHNGVKVVIDETSLDLLGGSVLDFREDLIGSYFQMTNPQATVTCGCGSSFGI